jgi:NADPH-dependent 2,4-dienoyl-CoA reductase/sulfur reductase-like enzyme
MTQLLIIGGSDAGISAALRAKEIAPSIDVTVVVADRFPNFSICGLPFYLSGEVFDWHDLAHRTVADIEREGIRLLLDHKVQAIDPDDKIIEAVGPKREVQYLSYDKLVIGTGAVSARPHIAGLDSPGVFPMRWMKDAFAVQRILKRRPKPKSAVVVGGGYIGMEMAESLSRRGLEIIVVEYFDTVLSTVDRTFGQIVKETLERHGVQVATGVAVDAIKPQGKWLAVSGSGGFDVWADLVIFATGVRPEATLAQAAGIDVGKWGAIRVNHEMETNIPGIYAAGDCAETWHRLLERYVYLPLGTTAHKQGRIAGENAVGGQRRYAGTLGTQVLKIFDLVVARTGLRDSEASEAGFDPSTIELETWDHKAYYPGAQWVVLRVTGDRGTGRLLGAQIIGRRGAEVSKRIDVFAAALFHRMAVDALNDLDLSYTPPLSSPWDPVQMAAQAWVQSQG